MKTKIVTIVTMIFVGAICAISASFFTQKSMKKAHAISFVNSNLYDLNYIVDALEELNNSESKEPIIREKLETILVTSLVGIRAIDPNIKTLQGTPTNALCRIVKYSHANVIAENGIGKYKDKELVKLATSYLKNIEPSLREILKNSDLPFYECKELFGIEKEYKLFK